jgi:hypothetical protein
MPKPTPDDVTADRLGGLFDRLDARLDEPRLVEPEGRAQGPVMNGEVRTDGPGQ